MLTKYLWLALAGGVGTVARFALAETTNRLFGQSFPWGTLAVNLVGCFLAGLLWTLFEARWLPAEAMRVVVLIGFLGAFTTFSSYVVDTSLLAQSADWIRLFLYVIAQNGIGLFAVMAGAGVARLI